MTTAVRRPSERSSLLLLLLGVGLLCASQLRFGVGLLAWIAPAPWLLYLRRTSGWRSRLLLLAALYCGWVLATAKIITGPIPLALAFGYAAPLCLVYGLALLGWDRLRGQLSAPLAVLCFPAAMVAAEWILHSATPFGVWGAAANTQLDDLPLLQLASLFGIAGVGFLLYWVAALVEAIIAERSLRRYRGQAALVGGLLLAAHAYGSYRLERLRAADTVLTAAVGTDWNGGVRIPDAAQRARFDDALFARSARAATAGARIVVWNEVATLTRPTDEPALLRRGAALARAHRIELVMAYVVLLTERPLRFENKYTWISADGRIDHAYLKHHPVPGEPAVRGTAPHRAVDTAVGLRASGALCYDYDFPRLAREHARLGVDLVALPASDWRGIDPLHTRMAGLRAIEGGFSILRSTRMGTSAGIDPAGRLRASASSFEAGSRILLVELPRQRVPTLYAGVGDLPLLLVSAAIGLLALRRTRLRTAVARLAPAAFAALLGACSLSTSGPRIPRYPQPRSALLLVDLQRDFLRTDGKLPVAAAQVEPLLAAVRRLAAPARTRRNEVVYVVNAFEPTERLANWFRNGAAVRGQPGAALDPRVPAGLGPIFTKNAADAFSNPRFEAHLRRRQVAHLIVLGVFADACVKHTIRGALNRGYRVTLVRDGVAASTAADVADAIATLRAEGVEVRSSRELLSTVTAWR